MEDSEPSEQSTYSLAYRRDPTVERNIDGGYDAPTEYFTEPISALGNDDPVTEDLTY